MMDWQEKMEQLQSDVCRLEIINNMLQEDRTFLESENTRLRAELAKVEAVIDRQIAFVEDTRQLMQGVKAALVEGVAE